MKRVWIVLGLVAAAGVGAYGQTARNAVVQDYEIFNYTSIYRASLCADKVFIDGALTYDRRDPRFQPKSDFEVGEPGREPAR